MPEITHYHSLDAVLEKAPPLDAICLRCKSLNFVRLFSEQRYDDWDRGYEDPRLDVHVATVAEVRESADQCRICYTIVAFHAVKRLSESECTSSLDENLEVCVLKPYRADALLHMKDNSEESEKETLATSIAVTFRTVQQEKSDGNYLSYRTLDVVRTCVQNAIFQGLTLFQKYLLSKSKTDWVVTSAVPEGLPPESCISEADSDIDSEELRVSATDDSVYEEMPAPLEISRYSYTCHICFFSLSASSCIGNRRALSSSDSVAGSAINWPSLKDWLNACETDHTECRRKDEILGACNGKCIRCIDVRTSQLVSLGFHCRYLALSYVWGAPQSETSGHAIRSIVQDNSKVIIQNLPSAVRDAIEVTKRLGERYLWVDCVCIDQMDIAVLQEQVDIMDRIYENALLTIVTSTIDRSNDDIPGLRRNSRLMSSIDVLIDGHIMKARCATSVVNEFFGQWEKRGWTFQEWLLSRRCLFFSNNQILFRCQESSGLESFVPPRSAPLSGKSSMSHFWADTRCSTTTVSRLPLGAPVWSFQTYSELVSDYTNRNLTYDSDVLRAFTGIMRKLQRSCGVSFVEGLPRTDLLRALLWSPMDNLEGKGTQSFRRAGRPSWTWSAFGSRSGYICWEVDEFTAPGTPFAQRYREFVDLPGPKSKRTGSSRFKAVHESQECVLLAMQTYFSQEDYPDLYKTTRYRRADVVLLPEPKQSRISGLMISSEVRQLLVHRNPPKLVPDVNFCQRSKDDVLHPATKKIIAGRHYRDFRNSAFWPFFVNAGLGGNESFSTYDAILLYEWDVRDKYTEWHQRVVAMIIDRMDDGTVERVSLTSICSDDWYTLPLVSEREDLTLV